MMLAETVKDSVIAILGADAAGRFTTIGYQRQTKAAQTVQNNNRLVQVWWDGSNFDRGKSGITGPKINDVVLKIQFTVSQSAQVDLATLESDASTAEQKSGALENMVESSSRADSVIDELWGIVFDILNDGRNLYLGQEKGVVANKWFGSLQKDQPPEQGGFTILTGTATLGFTVEEPNLGDSGNTPANPVYKNEINPTIDTDGTPDPVQKTGVRNAIVIFENLKTNAGIDIKTASGEQIRTKRSV